MAYTIGVYLSAVLMEVYSLRTSVHWYPRLVILPSAQVSAVSYSVLVAKTQLGPRGPGLALLQC